MRRRTTDAGADDGASPASLECTLRASTQDAREHSSNNNTVVQWRFTYTHSFGFSGTYSNAILKIPYLKINQKYVNRWLAYMNDLCFSEKENHWTTVLYLYYARILNKCYFDNISS